MPNQSKVTNQSRDKPRKKILDLLKQRGAMEAQDLAKELQVTAMAVRQHLYQLSDEKIVTYREIPRAVGRPAKLWELTVVANKYFPDAHAALAVDLVTAMTKAFGKEGLEELIRIKSEQQMEAYSATVDSEVPLRTKLNQLAKIRTEEGYMAEVLKQDGNYLLVENHCPICTVAASCTGLCASEENVFQKVLGEDAEIQRVEHILQGARRCAYSIKNSS